MGRPYSLKAHPLFEEFQRSLRVLGAEVCEPSFQGLQLFGDELLDPAKSGLKVRLGTEIPSHVPTFGRRRDDALQ
jgi:hypothetical protein